MLKPASRDSGDIALQCVGYMRLSHSYRFAPHHSLSLIEQLENICPYLHEALCLNALLR